MTLQIGAVAPDFEAETTEGRIRFHEWIGEAWCVLFSHPKDFTPVCTTELGYMARIKPEFNRRNVKIIGLSVDPVDRHSSWSKDIEELPDDRRHRPKGFQALRYAGGHHRRHLRRTHAGRQRDGAQRLRHRPGQE